jgi:hypothetical protein
MQGLSHNLCGEGIGLRRALLQAGQTQPHLPRAEESLNPPPLVLSGHAASLTPY